MILDSKFIQCIDYPDHKRFYIRLMNVLSFRSTFSDVNFSWLNIIHLFVRGDIRNICISNNGYDHIVVNTITDFNYKYMMDTNNCVRLFRYYSYQSYYQNNKLELI